jgi:hypothetical protein
MPFFSKAVQDITTADIAELLATSAVENVRLEFKREVPGPDDTIKKLSGFANTFGGYLVVGAAANSETGRIEALSGVDTQSNYKQSLIQRCHEGIWPPIDIIVSDAIPVPDGSGKVCYVIYTPESLSAPHFLNRGKGAWIRTDEFSQRFDTRLANYEQILHLGNRRALAVARRSQLFDRALRRFDTLVSLEYSAARTTSGDLGAHIALSVSPTFPTAELADGYRLRQLLAEHVVPWRQTRFPRAQETITQVDSVLSLQPASGFSLVEASTWGHLFYVCEIEHLIGEEAQPKVAGIHLSSLLGNVLVFLEHARGMLRALGYNGPLTIRCKLRRVLGKHFLYFPYGNTPELGPSSRLDDEVDVDLAVMGTRLEAARDEVAADLFKLLFFAMNWAERADDAALLSDLLNKAKRYNFSEQ